MLVATPLEYLHALNNREATGIVQRVTLDKI